MAEIVRNPILDELLESESNSSDDFDDAASDYLNQEADLIVFTASTYLHQNYHLRMNYQRESVGNPVLLSVKHLHLGMDEFDRPQYHSQHSHCLTMWFVNGVQ
ncbi:hypothetical protein T4B_3116 [Trichinella pseudospiralis]|uniref:Uncharacterized protein n=1 Tax=Trichinella pseudospiralis TaxID=6337 RepID=A0A0V1IC37_TRIPS|nr:hypothetical protein T4A_11009 [Trichinella pseudospiralis]KRZ20387.1 hypothetical protein T4B_3116 [Trichinella pseudospiralis]